MPMATKAMDDWVARVLGVTTSQSDGGVLSVVRLGRARVEWTGTRHAAVAGLARLRDAIDAEFRDDENQAAQLTAALAELRRRMDALDTTLEDQLDAVLNADPSGRPRLAGPARGSLQKFISFLDTDELMMELDNNEVLPDLVVVAPMRAALGSIQAAIG